MKLKSISGVVYHVEDLERTAQFYESLGFRAGKREADSLIVYVNWFWVEFRAQDGGGATARDAGSLLYLAVDDVDECYQDLLGKAVKPASEPTTSMGRREFMVVDPDGYQLVFFKKK
jgi:catechol 2,3-dioxygenase-like lactoylglutathione lyase family enzyme